MSKRPPWGHVSRHCVYCGKVGPRTQVPGGWAHKRCIQGPTPRFVDLTQTHRKRRTQGGGA